MMGAAYLQGIRMVGGETILSDPCFSGVDRLMKGGSAASLLTIHIGVMSADPDWLTIQCDWGSSDGSSSWISAWLNLFFFFFLAAAYSLLIQNTCMLNEAERVYGGV